VIAAFTIFLREGIEASMIVAILFAYLDKIGQRRHFKDIIIGVVSALLLAIAAGTIIFFTIKTYAGTTFQDVFETVTYLFATVVMTFMTFWMSRHARDLSGALKSKASEVIESKARFGLAAIAFQAVGRESLETMVFTLAIVFASSGQGIIIGGAAGLAVSLLIAFWIYKLGHRLNIGKAFKVMGIALMIFSAGLLVDAIENMQGLGWLPILSKPLWNSSSILSEQSAFGDIVHTFFGYSAQPTPLQVIAYVLYLSITVSFFVIISKHTNKARVNS
jgi:high-affinity iron transporter